MSRGKMILIYLFLSAIVVSTSIPFGLELRDYLNPEEDQAGAEEAVLPPTPTPQPTPTLPKWRQTAPVRQVFGQTKVFRAVVTPKPTPTRTPAPTPTATPKPLANNYFIKLCFGNRAIIVSYTLKEILVKEGDIIDEPLGRFRVLKVDSKEKKVEVQLVDDPSQQRWITKQQPARKAK